MSELADNNNNNNEQITTPLASSFVDTLVTTATANVDDIDTLKNAINSLKTVLANRKNGNTKIPYFLYLITTTAPGNTLTTLALGNNDTDDKLPDMVPITKTTASINESISNTIDAHMSSELKEAYSNLQSTSAVGGSRKRNRKHKRRHNTKRRNRK